MATSTVEDYLKAILHEEQAEPGTPVSMGRIATALDVAPGTVTNMVKTLADSKLLDYEPYVGVQLTESGRQLAIHVQRRHRLVELFLVQVLGMNWSEVHAEAERLEHAISDRLLERIDELLGTPRFDPHGDPIPGPDGQVEEPDLTSLARCPLGEELEVARVTDQSPPFLELVEERGLVPGSGVRVLERDEAAEAVELETEEGQTLSLGLRAAARILVRPAGSEP